MTVAAVRAELVTKLKTIDSLSGRSFGYAPDSLQPPTAFVGTMTINPRATFNEADMTVEVWVAVSNAASAERAANALDGYLDGDSSVQDALEATGVAWDSLAVTTIDFPVTIPFGAVDYTAARWTCEVML